MWKRKPIRFATTVMVEVGYEKFEQATILNVYDAPAGDRNGCYHYRVALDGEKEGFYPASKIYPLTEF